MTRVRILLVVALALSSMALLAVPASATLPAANTKFCAAAKKIGTGATPTAAAVNGFKAAAKQAPTKVKSAINTIVAGLSAVIKNHKPGVSAKYKKAIVIYGTYYLQTCSPTP